MYNRNGNEAKLLELADEGKCDILICDYVLAELEVVFKRKDIPFAIVFDLLETYRNVDISELEEINTDEIDLAWEIITDRKDRPIFIFALKKIESDENTFFVSGDKGFFTQPVSDALHNRVFTTKDMIEKILTS